MDDLFLVYINKIGSDWEGYYLYEFLFAEDIENVDGEDWNAVPAAGKPFPPDSIYISKVGSLKTGLPIKVIQESNTFAVWDAVDGVIALGYEDLEEYDEYPDYRVFFQFGESIKSVENKLYAKELVLTYNTVKKIKKNEI